MTNAADHWICVVCKRQTAPDFPKVTNRAEVYMILNSVWAEAKITDIRSCLCVGCLEERIARKLQPKDFQRWHPFNNLPGTARLLDRRGDTGKNFCNGIVKWSPEPTWDPT